MSETVSWSRLFEFRGKIHDRYPDIWDLRILRKRFPLMRETIRDGEKVLDIGASNRNLEARLKRHFPGLLYKSMDIDREQTHDYYSLDDICESFDCVLLFEVLEHLPLEEGIRLIRRVHELLGSGGRLILTTPNVFNPGRYWMDATHKVAYCYDELAGLLMANGFQIRVMYRTYNDAFLRYLFRVYVMSPLHRYLGVDFAKSILVVAEKP